MKNTSRALFNAYMAQVAQLNGVEVGDLSKKFAVSPAVEQKLETKIQDSSQFLKGINVYGVTSQEGEKIGLGIGSSAASTTDTNTTDRQTQDISALSNIKYRCEQTNFDTHIRYAQLDAWAKFPDFQTRLRDAIVQRMALDRIMIGFNGTSRAATSNRTTNPLLQDVNIGWLQQYRANAAARVMGNATTQIKVGAATGSNYANLDALAYDMSHNLIDPWFRNDPNLVVICGRGILNSKYFPVLNQAQSQTNVERISADLIISAQRIGGMTAVGVPYFPDEAMMVTRMDNLSLYWQEGTRRRTVLENAKRDRIENYESCNEAYVVEDLGAGCLVENIAFT